MFPWGKPRGVRRAHTRMSVHYRRYGVRRHTDRPSVTELPGLTSDPIYTADRRGGILISFGPNRMSEKGINPSRRHWPERPGSVNPTRPPSHSIRSALLHLRASDCPSPDSPGVGAIVFNPKCPITLKGIGLWWRAGGHHALRRFASQSKGRVHLNASNGRSFVMRLHTVLPGDTVTHHAI